MTRPYLAPIVIVLSLTALAFAQQSPDPNALLDLPVEAPVYGSARPAPPGPDVGGQPDKDPRDEPPPTLYGEEIESESDTLFYVLDISGSMESDAQSYMTFDGNRSTGSRLARAKAELMRSITGLSRNFKFNIVAYDCATLLWHSEMVEATDPNKLNAIIWIMGLRAGGATGTGPATSLALMARENRAVVLLTDGSPNCGATDIEGHRRMIRSNNTQGATINVFGIAASGTYRQFCQAVASDSGGSYFDVP